jgi:hypothetical protein
MFKERMSFRQIIFKDSVLAGRKIYFASTSLVSVVGIATLPLPGGKGGEAHKADNLMANCEPLF